MCETEVEHECAVCGNEDPEKAWIFRTKDVKPDEIVDGELKWTTKDGAKALCSIDCKRKFEEKADV